MNQFYFICFLFHHFLIFIFINPFYLPQIYLSVFFVTFRFDSLINLFSIFVF